MNFVLFDKNANIYAGLNKLKIIAVETISEAVKFDMKLDNPEIKRKFYNAVTGANFEAVSV